MKNIYTNKKESFEDAIEKMNEKVPILKGCPNNGQCFCTGACKEVVGYRDRTPEEKKRIFKTTIL